MVRQDVIKSLQNVRQLLHDVGWTKRCYARGADGVTGTNVTDPHASSFCLQGAIQRVCDGNDMLYYHTMTAVHEELYRRNFMGSMQLFNDECNDVIDVLLMLTSIISR